MKIAYILMAAVFLFLYGCEKTDDEVRSENAANAQAQKNAAAHEKSSER